MFTPLSDSLMSISLLFTYRDFFRQRSEKLPRRNEARWSTWSSPFLGRFPKINHQRPSLGTGALRARSVHHYRKAVQEGLTMTARLEFSGTAPALSSSCVAEGMARCSARVRSDSPMAALAQKTWTPIRTRGFPGLASGRGHLQTVAPASPPPIMATRI